MIKAQSKFDFLFIMDFTKSSYTALNYLIKLANNVDGKIELFYANNIKENEPKIKEKLQSLIEIIETENINVKSTYTNQKIELAIKQHFKNKIIVISKNSKVFKKVSHLLINSINNNVLLIENGNFVTPNNSIVIGCDNAKSLGKSNKELPLLYSYNTKKPIIVLHSEHVSSEKITNSLKNNKYKLDVFCKHISYNRLVEGFKDFISNNSVDLLCISKTGSNQTFFKKIFNKNTVLTQTINEINSNILIMCKQ